MPALDVENFEAWANGTDDRVANVASSASDLAEPDGSDVGTSGGAGNIQLVEILQSQRLRHVLLILG